MTGTGEANGAENEGHTSVNLQILRAEVDDAERILHDVAAERETLRIELKAPPRVRVLGDANAPAAVPESAD